MIIIAYDRGEMSISNLWCKIFEMRVSTNTIDKIKTASSYFETFI